MPSSTSLRTTQRYAHLFNDPLRAGLEASAADAEQAAHREWIATGRASADNASEHAPS